MAARPPIRDADTEVLEVAVELHAQDEAHKDAERARVAVREAAAELGVEEQLARAEEEVERRRAEAASKKARRGRWLRRLGAFVLAVGIGVALWQVMKPAPPTPWTLVADERAWTLDVSAGTVARETAETHEGRSVSVVTVDAVQPRADGTWFVNLDRRDVPAFAGHEALVIRLEGTLPRARVYLEAGADERWRSPPIELRPTWTDHRLPLAAFEHQRRVGGKWQVVAGAAPAHVDTVSVKLGHFVNDAGATGLVRVGEIHVE